MRSLAFYLVLAETLAFPIDLPQTPDEPFAPVTNVASTSGGLPGAVVAAANVNALNAASADLCLKVITPFSGIPLSLPEGVDCGPVQQVAGAPGAVAAAMPSGGADPNTVASGVPRLNAAHPQSAPSGLQSSDDAPASSQSPPSGSQSPPPPPPPQSNGQSSTTKSPSPNNGKQSKPPAQSRPAPQQAKKPANSKPENKNASATSSKPSANPKQAKPPSPSPSPASQKQSPPPSPRPSPSPSAAASSAPEQGSSEPQGTSGDPSELSAVPGLPAAPAAVSGLPAAPAAMPGLPAAPAVVPGLPAAPDSPATPGLADAPGSPATPGLPAAPSNDPLDPEDCPLSCIMEAANQLGGSNPLSGDGNSVAGNTGNDNPTDGSSTAPLPGVIHLGALPGLASDPAGTLPVDPTDALSSGSGIPSAGIPAGGLESSPAPDALSQAQDVPCDDAAPLSVTVQVVGHGETECEECEEEKA